MRFSNLLRTLLPAIAVLGALSVGSSLASGRPGAESNGTGCPNDDSGLKLPAGFCATVFADNIGHARHLVVAPSGVVYVNTWSGDYYPPGDKPPAGGFLVALQDKTGAGKAGVIERFGETIQTGGAGGTGIALYKGSVYAEINDRIVRYTLPAGSIVPQGSATTVVSGLPLGGDHPMHPFAITADGSMYIDVGTATNSCQLKNRTLKSPGADPCTELETRGGTWRYDANKTNQPFTPGDRFATGIRNGEGFAIDAAGKRVFVTQHGRDQLHANWPDLYPLEKEATLPAEELLLLKQGGDYGWPECYYDPVQRKLVLAPEYGGDGGSKVGVCANKIASGCSLSSALGAEWRGLLRPEAISGPLSQWRVYRLSRFLGSCTLCPGGLQRSLSAACRRPCIRWVRNIRRRLRGVSQDLPKKPCIVPVVWLSGPTGRSTLPTIIPGESTGLCMWAALPAAVRNPLHARAPRLLPGLLTQPMPNRRRAQTPMPVSPFLQEQRKRWWRWVIASTTDKWAERRAQACHGSSGKGTPLGPDLTDSKWLWSDGSYSGIAKTITDGVMTPKEYRSPMPPMGGAQLTDDQVKAVAAYVWSLSHH